MALLGGSGLLWGPILGVILLASAQQWLLTHISMLQATIYGTIIILIGRFIPGGLLRAPVLQRLPILRNFTAEHHSRVRSRSLTHGQPKSLNLTPRTVDPRRLLLECSALTLSFGGVVAVNKIDLDIRQGEIVGLVGPNGSGKTSLFNLISRVYDATSGSIKFDGQQISEVRRDQIAHYGIGRTYQIPRPFGDLTVRDNISTALIFGPAKLSLKQALLEAEEFAIYAGLGNSLDARADQLRLQERKALEMARALACRPKLLLVDEVASGLTTAEVKAFAEYIREIRNKYGITVIWVEHIFSALAQVVDRLVVLESGSVIADGALHDVMCDERVLKSYLGTGKIPA